MSIWDWLSGGTEKRASDPLQAAIDANMMDVPIDLMSGAQLVGQDELGNWLYMGASGATYTVPPVVQREPQRGDPAYMRAYDAITSDPVGMAKGIGSGILDSVVSGFTAPGRALAGEPVTMGDVWDTAGLVAAGGMPMEAPEDALRAFSIRTPGQFITRGSDFFDQPHGIARKKDPALYTPFSSVKHSTAPSEYEVSGQILPTLTDPQEIDPASLLGKTLYFPTGDRTSNQRLIESINGISLPTPVLTHGGPEYKDFQGSWASERTALRARENALKEAVAAGEDPLLAYMPMGERSGDFSKHMAETYGAMVDGQAMGHNMRSGLDDIIPQQFRDAGYPGINSGRFSEWLAGLDGGKRAAVVKFLDSAGPQELGMPDVGAARFAVTNPDLVKSDALSIGYRFSAPDVEKGLLFSSEHPSYGAKLERMPGTTSQTLGFEVPWWIGARDTAASKVTPKGYALPKDIKSYMGNPRLRQTVDSQWVDEVSTYGEILREQGDEAAKRYARGLLDAIISAR